MLLLLLHSRYPCKMIHKLGIHANWYTSLTLLLLLLPLLPLLPAGSGHPAEQQVGQVRAHASGARQGQARRAR
jgi:hypothetical protein